MNKAARQKNTRRSVPRLGEPVQGRRIVTKCLHATADGLLLVQTAAEPLWRYFWPVASVDLPGGVGGGDTDQYASRAGYAQSALSTHRQRREMAHRRRCNRILLHRRHIRRGNMGCRIVLFLRQLLALPSFVRSKWRHGAGVPISVAATTPQRRVGMLCLSVLCNMRH